MQCSPDEQAQQALIDQHEAAALVAEGEGDHEEAANCRAAVRRIRNAAAGFRAVAITSGAGAYPTLTGDVAALCAPMQHRVNGLLATARRAYRTEHASATVIPMHGITRTRARGAGRPRARRSASRSARSSEGGEPSDSDGPGERPRHEVALLGGLDRLLADSMARIGAPLALFHRNTANLPGPAKLAAFGRLPDELQRDFWRALAVQVEEVRRDAV